MVYSLGMQVRSAMKYFIFLLLNIGVYDAIENHDRRYQYVRLFDFELERNKLSDILVRLGYSEIYRSGDASFASTRIHYYCAKESTYITFNSSEVGGGIYITEFILSKYKPNGEESFKTLNDLRFQVKDIGGLRLGLSRNTISTILGEKTKITRAKAEKEFYRRIKATENKSKKINAVEIYFDELISITCTFTEDRVTKIEIIKVTSS